MSINYIALLRQLEDKLEDKYNNAEKIIKGDGKIKETRKVIFTKEEIMGLIEFDVDFRIPHVFDVLESIETIPKVRFSLCDHRYNVFYKSSMFFHRVFMLKVMHNIYLKFDDVIPNKLILNVSYFNKKIRRNIFNQNMNVTPYGPYIYNGIIKHVHLMNSQLFFYAETPRT